MRTQHDTIPEWVFADKPEKAAFSKGTTRMDRSDIQAAVDMFYDEMGWDRVTGAPTRATYRRVGLDEIAEELGKRKLLP